MQRTFAIVKPDAVRRNICGEILAHIQSSGLRIVAMKMIHMTKSQAESFYAVHKERPFYDELTTYMSSSPVVCCVLEGENAILRYREIMGATDPSEANEGTIRKKFALNKGENSVHGSDAAETAAFEIAYFFNGLELVN